LKVSVILKMKVKPTGYICLLSVAAPLARFSRRLCRFRCLCFCKCPDRGGCTQCAFYWALLGGFNIQVKPSIVIRAVTYIAECLDNVMFDKNMF